MRTEKWYDLKQDGNKLGYIRVIWTPSTWEGKKTVHDTTTFVTASQRDMGGIKDRFETTTTSDLERGEDGTLWWMRTRTEEAGRVHVSELRWTGKGYESSEWIVGQERNKQTITVAMEKPTTVDAESFLSLRARAGTLKEGETFDLQQLDLPRRRRKVDKLTILGTESVKDENGKDLACVKLKQVDPETGTETLLWMDDTGALVRLRIGGQLIERTTQAKAEAMPTRLAEYSITVGSSPRLERIFNADRTLVDLYIRRDAHRKMPEFPKSPWSRMIAVSGSDEEGFVIKAELKRYDSQAKSARLPVVDKAFERSLEATSLMQVDDPLVQKTVKEVVGDERDARTAAVKLARYVYTHLDKQSPNLGQAGAVQILKECRGDCSEHALLYVTLCRAAGIPARMVSGYVCIGGLWGGHAWAEIWTGQWIGADPTTGDVGTAARYLFFRYDEEPAVVSRRIRGRLRIMTTRIEEGKAAYDLTDPRTYRRHDAKGKRYLHVLAGLEARDVPDDWTVRLSGDNRMQIRGPDFSANLIAVADQGGDIDSHGRYSSGRRTTFGGAPALRHGAGSANVYEVFSRRRIIRVVIQGADPETIGKIEKVLAPTFEVPAPAWETKAEAKAEADAEGDK